MFLRWFVIAPESREASVFRTASVVILVVQ